MMKTQRTILNTIAIAALLAAMPQPVVSAETRDKPNIIFIMTDDQGYGDAP